MIASTESDSKQGTLSELAERLGNFHESANALTNCLQYPQDAKCMFSKLLEETNDDLDRALQPQEEHRARATGNGSRCSRAETSSESPCTSTEAVTVMPCSHFETEIEVIRSCSETISPSREPTGVCCKWRPSPATRVIRDFIQQRRMEVQV